MLNDRELEAYFVEHNVSEAAREYIINVRSSPPSRMAGEYASDNVASGYPSRKMGCSLSSESHTGEREYVVEFEYDDTVLEFWDQPEPIVVNRTQKNGLMRRGSYTADYLVLRTSGPEVAEVKLQAELDKLVVTKTDWILIDGHPVYVPARDCYAELGLAYVVLSTADLSPFRIENYRMLLASRNTERQYDAEEKILRIVEREAWVSISDIQEEVGARDTTAIFHLIDRGEIFFPEDVQLLSNVKNTWVSRTRVLAEAGILARYDGEFRDDVAPQGTEYVPTKADAERALKRLRQLEEGMGGRQMRRLKKLVEEGARIGKTAFQSLITGYGRSGNRSARLNKAVLAFIDYYQNEFYADGRKLSQEAGYTEYRTQAKKAHKSYPPVSRRTFVRYLKKQCQTALARRRGGKRAANAAKSPSPAEARALQAQFAYKCASVDHFLHRVFCVVVDSGGTTYKVKPWITVMRDQYTGKIIAFWMTLKAPSRLSVGMVLRRCVRVYGRLPLEIMVDRGPEFTSVYLSALAAGKAVELKLRPAAHARYGGDIERVIKIFKEKFAVFRLGNDVSKHERRAVSGSHAPQNLAECSIEEAWEDAEAFVEWYNSYAHGTEAYSPNVLERISLDQFPFAVVRVAMDDEFMVESAVDGGSYKVDPSRGIHVGEVHYWSPELASRKSTGNVDIRVEPENPYVIYADIDGTWVSCKATKWKVFGVKDPVTRLAESLRIREGRSARDRAKQEASEKLVEKMAELDRKRKEGKVTKALPLQEVPMEDSPVCVEQDIWADLVPAVTEAGKWGGGK